MKMLKQSEATAAKKRVPFTAVQDINWDTRLDASLLTFTVRVIKADGTSGAGGGSGGIGGSGVTQPDVTNAKGICFYTPSAGDLDTLGATVIRISAAGMETRELEIDVVAVDIYDAAAIGMTNLDAAVSTRSTATALAAALADLKGCAGHEHSVIDGGSGTAAIQFGGSGVLTLARERIFASKANADAATLGNTDNTDGEIRRYAIVAVDGGSGTFTSWKKTRTL